MLDALIAAFVLIGGFFLFVGSFGLAKLPDLMRRLHGPTKATTLGVGSLLIASMLHFATSGHGLSFHELLITLFLLITAPVSALMISKVHLLHDIETRRAAPRAPAGAGWATFTTPDSSGLNGE